MSTPPVRVERRAGQRFPYSLAVSLRVPATGVEGVGFTQDLSSRGVFFFTDTPLTEGVQIELTLRMPSEITLGENMPVRCRGKILRVVRPVTSGLSGYGLNGSQAAAETKIGVAVRLECYEYLKEPAESSTALSRLSTLHSYHDEEDRPVAQASARSF
jgi:hypothetical protein